MSSGHSSKKTVVDIGRSVAPMVAQSDAPFRTLCFKYGATVCYTEMLYSHRIVHDSAYLNAYLPPCDLNFFPNTSSTSTCSSTFSSPCSPSPDGGYNYKSGPLVAQICGHDPQTLAEAVKILAESERCDAVDLNLGCPQDRAKEGFFGSYMLDKCHWPVIFACVEAMVKALESYSVPLYCKIRIVEGSDKLHLTKLLCRGLVERGVRTVCIHGRTRGSAKHRRCGPADLKLIGEVAKDLKQYVVTCGSAASLKEKEKEEAVENSPTVRVISNGNIITRADVNTALKEAYPADGVMSAEGVLANPAVFSNNGENSSSESCSSCSSASNCTSLYPHPSLLELFEEYCALSEMYKTAGGWRALDSYCPTVPQWPERVATTTATVTENSNNCRDSSHVDTRASFSSEVPVEEVTAAAAAGPVPVTCFADENSNTSYKAESCLSSRISSSGTSKALSEVRLDSKSAGVSLIEISLPSLPSLSPQAIASTSDARSGETKSHYSNSNCSNSKESRQIYIARQHLSWMLGKQGHGRTVRFTHCNQSVYRKHCHLLMALKEAGTMQQLIEIARHCLS